jgi:hypothetical protein
LAHQSQVCIYITVTFHLLTYVYAHVGTGLSFHNHGKTWLAVVHGIKQWFIYPPGFDPPHSIDADYSPMLPVSRWINDVYPRLQPYPKPPFAAAANDTNSTAPAEAEGGFRPLECRQLAGDVLFLPSRWTHMTINIGETIAIGGQEALYDDARYVPCAMQVGTILSYSS